MKSPLNKITLPAVCLVITIGLAGCATSKDIEAVRTDMSVLEKQFLQVQRDLTRMKYTEEEAAPVAAGTAGNLDEAELITRISGLESRVSSLESQVRYLQQSRPPVDAVPMEPEPVGIPEESPPQIIVEPAGKDQPRNAPMRTVEEMYTEAVGLFRAGELDKSEDLLRRLLEQYPEDNKYSDNAQFYLGSIAFKREDYHRAVEEFDKVVINYPVGDKVPDSIYMTGLSYKKLGMTDRARMNFNKVMDNYPYSDAALKARQALDQAE